jgi:hypothetical protein
MGQVAIAARQSTSTVPHEQFAVNLVTHQPKILRKENLHSEGILAVYRSCDAMAASNFAFNFTSIIDAEIHGILDVKIRNWRKLDLRTFFDKLLKQYKPPALAPTSTLAEQIRTWPNSVFFVDPWNLNCLDSLFYKIEGLLRANGYLEAMPPHKFKELLDTLNDRFLTSFNRGGGRNPCIVLAEKLKDTAFQPKDWVEWFSFAVEEITRQNTILHESKRLGQVQQPPPADWRQLNRGYYPNLSWQNPNPPESKERSGHRPSSPQRQRERPAPVKTEKHEEGAHAPRENNNSLSVLAADVTIIRPTNATSSMNSIVTRMRTITHVSVGLNPPPAKPGRHVILPLWHVHAARPLAGSHSFLPRTGSLVSINASVMSQELIGLNERKPVMKSLESESNVS